MFPYERKNFPILLIVGCAILFSCNLSETSRNRNKAVIFLNRINMLRESVVPHGERFSKYIQIVGPLARENENYQLENVKIDTLSQYYHTFMQSIDKTTLELSSLSEFDTTFSMINSTIKYLKIIKNSYASCIPTYLLVYKIGWAEATDSSKKIIDQGPSILDTGEKSAAKERQNWEHQMKEFAQKYKI